MRRLFIYIGILIAISGITLALKTTAQQKQENKRYKVEMSLNDWATRINYLEYVKNQLRQSDIPSKQVAFITDSILIPFQTEISAQINRQIAAEQAAQKKDTTKQKIK